MSYEDGVIASGQNFHDLSATLRHVSARGHASLRQARDAETRAPTAKTVVPSRREAKTRRQRLRAVDALIGKGPPETKGESVDIQSAGIYLFLAHTWSISW